MKVSGIETYGTTISESAESTKAATTTTVDGQVQDDGSSILDMFNFKEEEKAAEGDGTKEADNSSPLGTVEIECRNGMEL